MQMVKTGDGAGILIDIPHDFLYSKSVDFELPDPGQAIPLVMVFLTFQKKINGSFVSDTLECGHSKNQGLEVIGLERSSGTNQMVVREEIAGRKRSLLLNKYL